MATLMFMKLLSNDIWQTEIKTTEENKERTIRNALLFSFRKKKLHFCIKSKDQGEGSLAPSQGSNQMPIQLPHFMGIFHLISPLHILSAPPLV